MRNLRLRNYFSWTHPREWRHEKLARIDASLMDTITQKRNFIYIMLFAFSGVVCLYRQKNHGNSGIICPISISLLRHPCLRFPS